MYKKSIILGAIACVMMLTFSCKKDNGLSKNINNIISQKIIDDLQKRGMTINKGSTPPTLPAIVLASSFTLVSPYGAADGWSVGKVIADYKYRFSGQTGDQVKLDYKNSGSDYATGMASFLSGSGNKFSLFAQVTGTSSEINYKSVKIISGEVTADGIKDFHEALVLTEKEGDESNSILMPVGAGRIWKDGDGLAETISTYRLNPAASTNSDAASNMSGK